MPAIVRRSSFVVRPAKLRSSRLTIRLWPITVLLALILTVPAAVRAQEAQNRAGLLIRHGDGHVVTICVRFGEPAITGTQLLERAGVSYLAQAGGMGSAVCKLDGEGCDYPTEDCFCQCKGANCTYWSYQHLRDGKWSYSQVGAASYMVRPGDVEGWAWGSGTVQNGAQPPLLSFDQICTESAVPTPATEAAAPPPTTAEPPAPTEIVAPPPATQAPAPPSPRPPQPTRAPTSPPSAATQVAAAPPTAVLETAAPRPTAAPQPPTAEPRPTAAPTQQPAPSREPRPSVTGAPALTSEPAGRALPRTSPQAGGGSMMDYLAFGALILALGSAIAVVLLRRRTRERDES